MLPTMQENTPESNESPRYDRSQNPPISSDYDLAYVVITSWPNISDQSFQDMSEIDQWEDTVSFIVIRRVLRELFT